MMQFDFTSFVLEILNFLVLVWILKRLLYRPVLNMLDTRRQKIADESVQAELLRNEAEALRRQYETHLLEWEKERETYLQKLDEELTLTRTAALENLKQFLADEEARLRAHNQSLAASQELVMRRKAADAAYAQAAAILLRLASPQLTHTIVTTFLEDLASLPETDLSLLRQAANLPIGTEVELISAHILDETDQAALSAGLSNAAGHGLPFCFKQDTNLIAGLRVLVGECQLHANLADELGFFKPTIKHD